MNYLSDRITIDENLMDGKPTIRGMRITVQTILELINAGDSIEDILTEYPSLEKEDILECINFNGLLSKTN